MNRRGFQDDAPPWSFFLPVTLAVVVGVLLADAARLAIGAVFVRDAAESAAPAKAPTKAPVPPDEAASAGENAPPAQAPATPDAKATTKPADDIDAPGLPGPMSAMRDDSKRACINGTVAERRPNGWEQALADDAPLRCIADSP
jgi:hypothetical protein